MLQVSSQLLMSLPCMHPGLIMCSIEPNFQTRTLSSVSAISFNLQLALIRADPPPVFSPAHSFALENKRAPVESGTLNYCDFKSVNACIKAIKVDLGWLKSHTSTCLMRKNRRKGWEKRQRRWELTEVMSVWGVWKVPETFLGRKSRPPRTQCVAAGLPEGIFFPTSSQLLKASSACIQSFGVNNREEPCADAIVQHLQHISSSSVFSYNCAVRLSHTCNVHLFGNVRRDRKTDTSILFRCRVHKTWFLSPHGILTLFCAPLNSSFIALFWT